MHLKPENIFVCSKNEIKLGDRLCTDSSVDMKTVHSRLGTLLYMAPKVCDKGRDHNMKVDIWALGVIFC